MQVSEILFCQAATSVSMVCYVWIIKQLIILILKIWTKIHRAIQDITE